MRITGDSSGPTLGEGAVLDLQHNSVPLRAIYEEGPVVLTGLAPETLVGAVEISPAAGRRS